MIAKTPIRAATTTAEMAVNFPNPIRTIAFHLDEDLLPMPAGRMTVLVRLPEDEDVVELVVLLLVVLEVVVLVVVVLVVGMVEVVVLVVVVRLVDVVVLEPGAKIK